MSIPKEPRQQMINLMYLVLTALLALNVSAEILNAFRLVNEGINNSNIALSSKNASIYANFEEQMEQNAAKTKPFYDKAKEAKQISDEFTTYVDNLKEELVQKSGGRKEDGELEDEKNLDVTTHYMIEKKKGQELEQKIIDSRSRFLALIEDPNERAAFEGQISLSAKYDPKKSNRDWAAYNFEMVPVIAALTIMTKFQSDAKNTESIIIEHLIKNIDKTAFKFDELEAKVIAPSSYIMQGQPYVADIFVSARSTTQNPEVIIGQLSKAAYNADGSLKSKVEENPIVGNGESITVENGEGKYKVTASGAGVRQYSGAVKVMKPGATTYEYYPFESEYQVAAGGVVVSPDKLNVIYAGIPNPMSISVAGFPDDKVSAGIGGGGSGLSKTGTGKYMATAKTPGEKAVVSVSVKTDQGVKTVGSAEFRIKRVPDPIAAINGTITEGEIKTGTIKAVPGIGAVLKDFDFEGVVFEITNYEVLYVPKRQDPRIMQNSGWRFSQTIKETMSQVKPGDQLVFRKIQARGPDGSSRRLNVIALSVE